LRPAAALVGAVGGIGLAAIPALLLGWPAYVLQLVVVLLCGAALAYCTYRGKWDGLTLVRRVALAAFVTSTAFLVVGSLVGNFNALAFPLLFFFAGVPYGLVAVFGAALVRHVTTRRIGVQG
jgi:hypothetical protein